jgi:RimJ/RimL family protein N-acetyltransferase
MPAVPPPNILLRPTCLADIPTLFGFQLDGASNDLAGTKPRDLASFMARWHDNLRNPDITPRVIVEGEVIVGSIDIFKQEGQDSIGYWIARDHWGRGIASRAIALMLQEVAKRPLFARVALHNTASRRALERNGFVVASRDKAPEDDRYAACERFILKLA